jgi:citronellol/citronellal dehydrogenase
MAVIPPTTVATGAPPFAVLAGSLAGRTLVMSGGSRGIGLAIALRAARDGANVVLLAKTDKPDPRLSGTVHTAIDAIEAAGGQGLAVVGDVRSVDDVDRAVKAAVDRFGGIDGCINNASALDLSPTRELQPRRFDLMHAVNVRGTFMLSRACIPYLEQSDNPHILTLSPPPILNPKWAAVHLGYTLSKYGMSLCTLGLAEELRDAGVAANSLWPRTTIATDAVRNLLGGDEAISRARRPEIVADAAHVILTQPAAQCTGNFFIDDEVLTGIGIYDLERYRVLPGGPPLTADIFIEPHTVDR